MLTPEYASPEQVRGLPATTASDIYSLGVVFYQLLTGGSPTRRFHHVRSNWNALSAETQPARPSTMRRDRGLAGDLDNIVLMALRKEPERRYTLVNNSAKTYGAISGACRHRARRYVRLSRE